MVKQSVQGYNTIWGLGSEQIMSLHVSPAAELDPCFLPACRFPAWCVPSIGAAVHQLDAAHLAKAAGVQHCSQHSVQGASVAAYPVLDRCKTCHKALVQAAVDHGKQFG